MANIENYDVVIVGGGLGGLTAGALLAKKGLKVHLIEAHQKVGGFATTFRRKRYVFEVAIHVIDGEQPLQVRKEIFDLLEVHKNIDFVKIPEFYECHFQNQSIKIPDNFFLAKEVLLEKFPTENQGIKALFKAIDDVYKQMNNYMLRKSVVAITNPTFQLLFPQLQGFSKISTGQFFDTLFNDPFLKATMLATVTFYHNDRYQLSAVQYLYALGCYLNGGAYYIKGGSQVFSDYLAKIITNHGGKVETNHLVQEILVENDKAQKVTYKKNTLSSLEEKTTQGKYVIVNASIPNAYKYLIKKYSKKNIEMAKNLATAKYSTSAVNIFCGLKKSLQDLGNRSYLNVFLEPQQIYLGGQSQESSFGVIDNHIIDTGICPEGVNTCEIIYMENHSEWSSLTKEEYLKKKEIIAQTTIKKMEKYYPRFSQNLDLIEVGTPKTITRFTSNPDGAIYGYRPDSESYFKRLNRMSINFKPHDENIKNLYFASAWSFMPGFTGAMSSGYQAALGIGLELGLNMRPESKIQVD